MKNKIVSVVTLFVSCGMISQQSLAHTLAIPHTHTGLAMIVLFGIVAVAVATATLMIKRRG